MTLPAANEPAFDSDQRVMERLRAGDLDALSPLYLRYGKLVASVIARSIHPAPRADVDDLVQEVFLAVAASASRYRDTGNFRGWLVGVAMKKAREHGRKGWLRRNLFERFGGGTSEERVEPSNAFEARQGIERALATLDEGQRQVMVLTLVEGLSGAEVAAALGIEEKTVWTRLHRARALLRARDAEESAP